MEYSDGDHDDQAALVVLLRAVPPELIHALAVKDTPKEAWDTLKTLCMGSEHTREARVQTRRREFEELRFHDGESIEDCAHCITAIVNDLNLLNGPVSE